MKPIRLIELFAGIGAQAKALENLGIEFETYRVVEFDKYAIKSYNAVHHTNFVATDITKITAKDLAIVDTDKFDYIMTYSFPCQDLSLAGKQAGMEKGSGTRSGLLWEVERLLNECTELPQVLLMENVTQVHGKKNKDNFDKWCRYLEGRGYRNFWKDLNAKDYGIPQNRNRCFMVSLLNGGSYKFPQPFELQLRLKDMLEDNVEDKYYLSNKLLNFFINNEKKQISKGNGFRFNVTDGDCTARAVTTRAGGRMDDNYVYDTPSRVTGFVKNKGQDFEKPSDIATTLLARDYKGFPNQRFNCVVEPNRIRKLTPLECWRLMGFEDKDFYNAEKVNSNTQLYKQAGNSIVVNVLMQIFQNLFEAEPNTLLETDEEYPQLLFF